MDMDNRALPSAFEQTPDEAFIFIATAGTNHIACFTNNLKPYSEIVRASGNRIIPGDEKASMLFPDGLVILPRGNEMAFILKQRARLPYLI